MKNFFTQSRPILLPARTTNSRGVRGFNFRAAAFRCVLLTLGLFGGIGLAQGQQPDPLTITKEGNVGVGTITPANKLSVAGNADFSGNVGIGTTTSKGTLTVGNSTAGGNYAQDAVSGWRDGYMLFRAGVKKASIGMDSSGAKLQFFTGATADDNTARLTLDSNGNVGIGTASPGYKLDVYGPAGNYPGRVATPDGYLRFGPVNGGWAHFDTDRPRFYFNTGITVNTGIIGSYGDGDLNLQTGDTTRLTVTRSAGNVGIGTTSPGKGKLEINGTASGDKPGFSYLRWLGTDGLHTGGSPNESLSIYASGSIGAGAVFVFSDERIKNIRGRSDGGRDLETLLGIEITDYEYDDPIGKDRAPHKKVIGQQVEKVFPEAVSRSTDVVPDIYQKATIKDGWVMLATTLKKGDRVRLIGRSQEGLNEVLEIADGKFRTAFAPEGDQVFVYGREVKDFRSVDYDAISMLNVSATQQIKREKDAEVKALQAENAALRGQLAEQEKRLAELEAKDKSRDEKLAAIETMLMSRDQQATRNASPKKAN